MKNTNLHKAKAEKNDEFYTQYHDIEKEMNAYLEYDPDVFRGKTVLLPCDDPEWSNFTKYFAIRFDDLGLKKLISTSYAPESKNYTGLFSTLYNEDKSKRCGKIFILDRDNNGDGRINYDDLQWDYLSGNGDFASEEVTKLRDEADFIITNPPFSKFRDFVSWILAAPEKKRFSILGSINAITYKDIFPLIASNQMWIGPSISSGVREFRVPEEYGLEASSVRVDNGKKYIRVKGIRWFTNIYHGRKHEPMSLMSMEDNIRFNKKLKGQPDQKYDNYDAIDVPFTNAIPSDYDGVMGVPITFLDKYCPEQFEIVTFVVNEDGTEDVVPVNDVFREKKKTTSSGRRSAERTFTGELSSGTKTANTGTHEQSEDHANKREESLRENTRTLKTTVPGLLKSPDSKVAGASTFVRISIRHKR